MFTMAWGMGAYGLAWAQSIVAFIEVVVLFVIMSHRIPNLFNKLFMGAVVRMMSATGFMAIVTYLSVKMFELNASDQSFFGPFLRFSLIVLLSATAYIIVSKLMRLKEVDPILKRVGNFFFKDFRTKKGSWVSGLKPTHADIEKLLRTIVLPFYHVKRDMPLPIGERRWENDAEHSWSVAFLACVLAPQIDATLDIGKICQFAVAHDIVEIYANDTSVFASDSMLDSKQEREEQALAKIAEEFAHFPWIVETVEAYEQRDSNEAKFVYALDKYIAVAYDYIDQGKLFRERKVTLDAYNKSLEHHRQKAQSHPEIGKYYEEVRRLLDEHPEFFHAD